MRLERPERQGQPRAMPLAPGVPLAPRCATGCTERMGGVGGEADAGRGRPPTAGGDRKGGEEGSRGEEGGGGGKLDEGVDEGVTSPPARPPAAGPGARPQRPRRQATRAPRPRRLHARATPPRPTGSDAAPLPTPEVRSNWCARFWAISTEIDLGAASPLDCRPCIYNRLRPGIHSSRYQLCSACGMEI